MILKVVKIGRKIEVFNIEIDEKNEILKRKIKENLKYQKSKIINKFKKYKELGYINSIRKPRTTKLKLRKELKRLIYLNQLLSYSISKL